MIAVFTTAASCITPRPYIAWRNLTDTVTASLITKPAGTVLVLIPPQMRNQAVVQGTCEYVKASRAKVSAVSSSACCMSPHLLMAGSVLVNACEESPMSLRLCTGHLRGRWLLGCGYTNSSLGPEVTVRLCM